jgi:hypothetical protein
MPESLSFENFFTKFYILDHEAQNLIKEDQTKTLVYSVMLRIFTLGLVHLGCVIAQAIQKGSVAKGGTIRTLIKK